MNLKKYIINIILIFVTIMCFGLSIGYCNELKRPEKVTNFYLDNKDYNLSIIKDYIDNENNILGCTAWKQIDDTVLINEETNREAIVDVIKIYGNSYNIIEGDKIFLGDVEGCLVDKEAAYNLFGGTNVIGNTIKYENRELTIRGIHNGVKNTVVMQFDNNEDELLDGISVNSEKSAENISTILSIKNNGVSNELYTGCASFFMNLLPIIMLIISLYKILKAAFSRRKMPVKCMLYILIALISTVVLVRISGINISIPYEIIPNKWSDFTYWSQLFEVYKEQIQSVLYMKKYNIDIYYIELAVKSIFYSIISLITFIIFIRRMNIETIREVVRVIILIIIIEAIVIYRVNVSNNMLLGGTIIWALYPYFILINNYKIIGRRVLTYFDL